MVVKIILLQKVIFHYGKRNLFWSFIIFAYQSFKTVRGQKIGFNSCECMQFLNIANIWGKRIFICNKKKFFLCFFPVYSFCNATFFHSGYVIKPPQPSSAIYGAPPFTSNPIRIIHCLPKIFRGLESKVRKNDNRSSNTYFAKNR